jgi:hypothetical protein
MVEYNLGPGALLHEFELRNRIDARRPAAGSPGLHDALARHKFDVSSRDVATEERERASLSLLLEFCVTAAALTWELGNL